MTSTRRWFGKMLLRCCHDFNRMLPWFRQDIAMISTISCHDCDKMLPWFQQDLAMHDFNKILPLYLVNQFSSMNIQPHKTLFKFSIKLTVTTVNVSVINQPQPPLRFMNWVFFFILIAALHVACKCMSSLNSSESTLCKKNTTYTYNLDRF